MVKKKFQQTGKISIPMLTVIISTLCAVALILAFTFLFRTNSEIVHGKNSAEAISFNQNSEEKSRVKDKNKDSEESKEKASKSKEKEDEKKSDLVARAAPSDAVEGSSFKALDANVSCVFKDSVSCTIAKYTFKAPEQCKNLPITFTVNESNTTANCSRQVRATGDSQLTSGKSMKNNGYACTVSNSAVECWSEKTGSSFTISNESASYTQD